MSRAGAIDTPLAARSTAAYEADERARFIDAPTSSTTIDSNNSSSSRQHNNNNNDNIARSPSRADEDEFDYDDDDLKLDSGASSNNLIAAQRLKRKQQEQREQQERFASKSPTDKRKSNSSSSSKQVKGFYANAGDYSSKEAEAQQQTSAHNRKSCVRAMFVRLFKRKSVVAIVVLATLITAIYCVPYVDIDAAWTAPRARIPFNWHEGPLRASSPAQHRVEHLFVGQIHGPESVALDAHNNMYMAIEGGFVLYVHMNRSSPLKRDYYASLPTTMQPQQPQLQRRLGRQVAHTHAYQHELVDDYLMKLVKIAELNSPLVINKQQQQRFQNRPATMSVNDASAHKKRECQVDEQLYGAQLSSGGAQMPTMSGAQGPPPFRSHVPISRCSKPLGIRLSADETYLYIVDTMSGLYRVDLRRAERAHSTQRLVTRLLDFRAPAHRLLPVLRADNATGQPIGHVNVSLIAVDDLAVEFAASVGTGDVIYMTLASQRWPVTGVMFDALEARASAVLLRYDTSTQQLGVLDPSRVAHVRTAAYDVLDQNSRLYRSASAHNRSTDHTPLETYMGVGAPHLDENDVFDDRPLHFANGIELTDDKHALLVADTLNKRLLKYHIKGPRRGSTDLWAWVPNFPDNIRRGADPNEETYWTVGCGKQRPADHVHFAEHLDNWPMVRKFTLKLIYLVGRAVEAFGTHIYRSPEVQNFGYFLKHGNMLSALCDGLMIIQLDKNGDIIRSIHGEEFPRDTHLYSQVNEVIDHATGQHYLYLSAPYYTYVTKLYLSPA